MAKLTPSRTKAYVALLLNALLWGLALPIVKKGYEHGLTPNTFLLSRMFFALIFSLPIIYLLRNKPAVKKVFKATNLAKIIPLELVGTVLALLLLYEGVRLTTAIESSLIAMTSPIFITLGGIFLLKERQQRNEWIGLTLALLGTFLLVIKPLLSTGLNGDTLGNMLIIGQNLAITFYFLIAKRAYKGLNKLAVIHISFWVGTASFFILSLLSGLSPITAILGLFTNANLWPLIAVLYMAIPGSILGLTLYLYGQDKIEASEASLFTYLQPIFSIPASIILLGETASVIEIAATITIIVGVYIAEKR